MRIQENEQFPYIDHNVVNGNHECTASQPIAALDLGLLNLTSYMKNDRKNKMADRKTCS